MTDENTRDEEPGPERESGYPWKSQRDDNPLGSEVPAHMVGWLVNVFLPTCTATGGDAYKLVALMEHFKTLHAQHQLVQILQAQTQGDA